MEAVAVVAAIFSGDVQPRHHLVPGIILSQDFRIPHQVTLGQLLEFTHHLLSLVHGVEAMDPEHDFDLYLQGQHAAKRLVVGVNQSSAVHV